MVRQIGEMDKTSPSVIDKLIAEMWQMSQPTTLYMKKRLTADTRYTRHTKVFRQIHGLVVLPFKREDINQTLLAGPVPY